MKRFLHPSLVFPAFLASLGVALVGCGGPPPIAPEQSSSSVSIKSNAPQSGGTDVSQAGAVEEPPPQPGKYGGKLALATTSDPKTFNLWISAETSTSDIVGPLYEALNQRNSYTLQFEPRLAELPKISEDGLTYTYTLQEGVKWSDDQPLSADDVIFTLDLIYDPKTETIMREGMLIDVDQPDGTTKREPFKYRKVDERTVEFKLPQRFAPAESVFSFPIAPRHKLEGAVKAGKINSTWGVSTPPSELVSSGAWVISEYVPGQRLVYKRNPNFWGKRVDGQPLPYLDEWVVLIVPDVNTAMLKFRNGDTDITGVQHQDFPVFKKEESQKDFRVINRGPGWGFSFLGFNLNPNSKANKDLVSLFQDVRFRRAASHLINRERMCEDIFLGMAQPLYGPVTPANKTFFNPSIPKFEYNPEKAKTLLADAGLKDGDGNGFLEYRGKEVKFNILTVNSSDPAKQTATIIADDMKKAGINATFTPIDFNDLVRRLDSPPYDWETCILAFTGGPEPHDGSNIWRSSGPSHQWWPKQTKPATPWEAEIDKLWTQGARELDPAKRKEIYGRWQEIVAENLPFCFTFVTEQLTAVRNRFGNLKPPSTRDTLWNIEEVFDTTATRATP